MEDQALKAAAVSASTALAAVISTMQMLERADARGELKLNPLHREWVKDGRERAAGALIELGQARGIAPNVELRKAAGEVPA